MSANRIVNNFCQNCTDVEKKGTLLNFAPYKFMMASVTFILVRIVRLLWSVVYCSMAMAIYSIIINMIGIQ